MRSEKSIRRSWRLGLMAIAALAFSVGLALGKISPARADNDDPAADAQRADGAAEQASAALDSATDARNQLESDGAPQDQIDAANAAVAQARAEKDAADEAARQADQAADEAAGETPDAAPDAAPGN